MRILYISARWIGIVFPFFYLKAGNTNFIESLITASTIGFLKTWLGRIFSLFILKNLNKSVTEILEHLFFF